MCGLFKQRAARACVAAAAALAGCLCFGADTKAKPKHSGHSAMDYGPFLSASWVSHPDYAFDNGPGYFNADSAARGIAIRLSDDWDAGIVFDADTLRFSCGWIGGPFRQRGLIFDNNAHGYDPSPSVPPLFQTPNAPGWANAAGSFEDPRPDSIAPLPRPGHLPKAWAHYRGLYRHGSQVILSYTVGAAQVLEMPSLETTGEAKAFVRTLRVTGADQPMAVMLADGHVENPVPAARGQKLQRPAPLTPASGGVQGLRGTLGALHFAVLGAPAGSRLEITAAGQMVLRLPATVGPTTFKILLAGGGEAGAAGFDGLAKQSAQPLDLARLTHGGPSLWKEVLPVKCDLATGTEPYVVDHIGIPSDNPYHAWMRLSGLDFFTSDPTKAAVSTWNGDVWIVSGIDQRLDHVTWKRFATGLHQPLGLKIVNDVIYTVGHDQVTRLRDLDGDGEADFYENFNNDWELTAAFHAFCFDLHTDPAGNFYFAFGSPVHAGGGGFMKITRDHGSVLKVSADGSTLTHVAHGLRAPNGMCVGPEGQITCGDNQGSYVPVDPIHWIKPPTNPADPHSYQFLGVADSAHGSIVAEPKPLCWLPYPSVDNSTGSQVWVTSSQWGPFKGDLLHCSYGQSSLWKVMTQEVDGQMQGGVVRIPVKFSSSAMRARFNPRDGQLYVVGLRGWQTNAGKEAGFDRVRYTGAPVNLPTQLRAVTGGVYLTFTGKLDPETAKDLENYEVEAWNYKWSSGYGSAEYPVAPPKAGAPAPRGRRSAHTPWAVASARLLPDCQTLFLQLPDIRPVMQMKISGRLRTADGKPLSFDIFNTIHNLAPAE